jgi:hypothetical protein
MIKLTSSIDIYRSAQLIFEFISSPANNFEWQYGTLASGTTSRVGNGVGTVFQTIGHLMGRRMNSTFEVTQYEPNRRYGFRSVSGPMQLITVFSLDAGSGHTRLTVTTQAAPTNASTGGERGMELYMQKQLREDLAMLKQLLESRSAFGALSA